MSWKRTITFIGTLLLMTGVFLTPVVAYEGRLVEKQNFDAEYMDIMILFSPDFEKEPYLSELDVHSVVAIDTFSDITMGVWSWLYRAAEETNEPWLHATYIDADIVPVGHRYNVQEFFDAVIMVRSVTHWDMYQLLDSGWTLGNMHHVLFDGASTIPEPGNYFEPRNFHREQDGRFYEGIRVDNVIYRISTKYAHVFSYGDGFD